MVAPYNNSIVPIGVRRLKHWALVTVAADLSAALATTALAPAISTAAVAAAIATTALAGALAAAAALAAHQHAAVLTAPLITTSIPTSEPGPLTSAAIAREATEKKEAAKEAKKQAAIEAAARDESEPRPDPDWIPGDD